MRRPAVAALVGCLLAGPVLAADDRRPADTDADARTATALHHAHARWLAATGDPVAAAATLRSHGIQDGPGLARLYAELGLTEAARGLLAQHQRDPAATAAWLALGEAHYRLGEYVRAEQALLQISRNIDDGVAGKRASLLARALLRQGHFDEAALALAGQRRREELLPLDRYNLGVAWLRAGDSTRGAAELEAVGRYDGDDPALRTLADHANLKLGYWFLRDERGGLARRMLQRIRLDGPFTEEAMLALGWAELAPAGDVQRLHAERLEKCQGPQSELWSHASEMHAVPRRSCGGMNEWEDTIGGEPARENTAAEYRRAAVAWRETADAPALRPAVQEALVALPYALVQAGDRAQALAAYRRAVERLSATQAAIDAGETAPAPPSLQIEPPQRLAVLDASLRDMDRRLERLAAWLDAPPESGRPDPDAVERLGEVLAELRAAAPPGRDLGRPSGVQRARLQALLRSLQTSRAGAPPAERLDALRQRVPAVREDIRQSLQAVTQAQAALEAQRRERLRQRVSLYLEQARLGLASLLE